MKLAVIGIGLIGGSLALTLKEKGYVDQVIGVSRTEKSMDKALALGLIDEKASLESAVRQADLIVLAVPMSAYDQLLPEILDLVNDKQVVIDVGSTKAAFLKKIAGHKMRGRFVPTHPMAGTEYSGPEAAVDGLFENKCTVLCNVEDSDKDAVALVEEMYKTLDMSILYLNAAAHDMHAAYVSHISHISSFALALTVLEKEKEEDRIFELASGGFESTVRLAKSSPAMWAPIFMENRYNVLDSLYEMIFQLKKMKQMLIDHDEEGFYKLIEKANEINKIIK